MITNSRLPVWCSSRRKTLVDHPLTSSADSYSGRVTAAQPTRQPRP